MTVVVSLTTRVADRYSGDSYTLSEEALESGVNVVTLFPNSYHKMVAPIWVKTLSEEGVVEVASNYGSRRFPIDKNGRWESGEIPLSFAYCEISIKFNPIEQ